MSRYVKSVEGMVWVWCAQLGGQQVPPAWQRSDLSSFRLNQCIMLEMRFRPCPCKGGLLSNLRHFRLSAYLGSWLYNAIRIYVCIYIFKLFNCTLVGDNCLKVETCWNTLLLGGYMEANQLDVELARVLCLTHIRVPCHKWLCFPSNFPRFHVLAQIWTRYLWMRLGVPNWLPAPCQRIRSRLLHRSRFAVRDCFHWRILDHIRTFRTNQNSICPLQSAPGRADLWSATSKQQTSERSFRVMVSDN